jgi:hypothetical protein
MTDRLMTYDELAAFLGRTPEAARQLAKRKRWRRVTGNDGKARVTVPIETVEEVEANRAADPATTSPAAPRSSPERPAADRPDVIAVLTGHISRLERELETARQRAEGLERDRDAALARGADRDAIAAQVDALRSVLDVERKVTEEVRQRADEAQARTDEVKAERDRWVGAAEAAQARIAELTAKAAELEARRGWWPFRRRA